MELAVIAIIVIALMAIEISSYIWEKFKEMKNMLMTLINSISGIGNSNYQRSKAILSGFEKKDKEI